MARAFAAFSCLLLLALSRPAHAWIETQVVASEARLLVDRSGKAEVEHRITLYTNGNERLQRWSLVGVDDDATPLDNSYIVPEAEALSSSLASAVALRLTPEKRRAGDDDVTDLLLEVDDKRGLKRGRWVAVVRYRTDLRAGAIREDGALSRLDWRGPSFVEGLDKARVVFALPSAPTPPRPAGASEPDALDAESEDATLLHDVRRTGEHDEIELVRTYAPAGEAMVWAIRFDPRALEAAPVEPEPEAPKAPVARTSMSERRWYLALAGMFVLVTALSALKSREVKKRAAAAKATMPAVIPLPLWLRAPLAGAALSGGIALELVWRLPLWGAMLVVVASALVAHGAARLDPRATLRGPGRWLAVSEAEALELPPRLRGAWLDLSTRAGKMLFVAALAGVGALVWRLRGAPLDGVLVGLDAIVLLALFGTGRAATLPPDMAVEPARFLRQTVRRLRRMLKGSPEGTDGLRLVPRVRIPAGEVDADELRLAIVPRVALRGFGAIEIGLTYALGTGARVAMPEVLLRVVAGSPCDQAIAPISAYARITPGRKPDERVLSFTPRIPSARHTAAIAAALAARVTDRSPRATPKSEPARAA